MKASTSPLKLLLGIGFAAVAISGWLWGWHWRSVAQGHRLADDERVILSLQRQLDLVHEENRRLARALQDRAQGGAVGEGERRALRD